MLIPGRRQRHLEPGGWTRRLDKRLDDQLTERYLFRALLIVVAATLMLLVIRVRPALTLGPACGESDLPLIRRCPCQQITTPGDRDQHRGSSARQALVSLRTPEHSIENGRRDRQLRPFHRVDVAADICQHPTLHRNDHSHRQYAAHILPKGFTCTLDTKVGDGASLRAARERSTNRPVTSGDDTSLSYFGVLLPISDRARTAE